MHECYFTVPDSSTHTLSGPRGNVSSRYSGKRVSDEFLAKHAARRRPNESMSLAWDIEHMRGFRAPAYIGQEQQLC
jgi:hypothetical protein